MRASLFRRHMVVAVLVVAGLAFVPACSTNSTSTSGAVSPASSEALGTSNPAPGDCTTNTSEASTSVGSVALSITPSSFRADIQVTKGFPNATFGVFMQQVPGSCPQKAANGGTLTTDSSGHGQASPTVPRVAGATTFFVQLVPLGSGPPEYTSDRISAG